MAELNASSTGGLKNRSGVKKSKKLSTRVDLTPMVDLGFLLITFFIFTTTISRPKAMHLFLPKESPNPIQQKESGALTLIPSGNERLYYYEGMDPSKLQTAPFQSLREIIRNKQNKTNPADFMAILKPTNTCTYQNTIACLDEMTINKVTKYALVDISPVESKFVEEMERYNK
jgi:biopolymer transport protein ExbD